MPAIGHPFCDIYGIGNTASAITVGWQGDCPFASSPLQRLLGHDDLSLRNHDILLNVSGTTMYLKMLYFVLYS